MLCSKTKEMLRFGPIYSVNLEKEDETLSDRKIILETEKETERK